MARDHIVPQFYLKNFHNSNSKTLIFSYKKGKLPIESSIRKQVGFIEDYYTIDEREHKISIEINNLYIGHIENESSRIIRKIIDSEELALNNKDKACLSRFVANLAARNPLVHIFFKNESINENTENFFTFSKTLVSEVIPNELNSILSVEEFNEIVTNPEEHFTLEIDDSEGVNKSIYRAMLPLFQSELLGKRLFNYNWYLLLINTNNFFVTSDNPVVFLYPGLPDKFLLRKSPVFLPVSPKLALLIQPTKFEAQRFFIDDNLADFYIRKSITFANNLVFAHVKSDKIRELFDEINQNLSELNYQFNFFSHEKLQYLIEKGIIKV